MKYKIRKVICLLLGLFILALGIAISKKSGLGVGPTSSFPLVVSEMTPLSMGTMTMIMNGVFVLCQIAILRKKYKPIYLLQLVVAFFFSFFTDFTLWLVRDLEATNYAMQMVFCIASCVIMAIGVFLEVRAGLITMATEGLIKAIADAFKLDFGTTKMIFDWGMVVVSAIVSFIALHSLVGIREGTVIAAFLVGYIVRFFNKHCTFIYPLLGMDKPGDNINAEENIDTADQPFVITIEREWGSGGHEIGEKLAKALNIPLYDYAVISKTAEETGLQLDEIQKKEQKLTNGLLYSIYNQYYSSSTIMSEQDMIFEAQQKVIRAMASKESCVIVGRLGAYALKNHKNTFDMFITADPEFRNKRIAIQMGIDEKEADSLRKKEDAARRNHCHHFTGDVWGISTHYNLTMETSQFGIDNAVNIILDALNKRA